MNMLLNHILGDLHDGTGLSDTTSPDGETSNKIFDELSYDLLTIGMCFWKTMACH